MFYFRERKKFIMFEKIQSGAIVLIVITSSMLKKPSVVSNPKKICAMLSVGLLSKKILKVILPHIRNSKVISFVSFNPGI